MWKIVIIDDDRQIIRSMKKMSLWQEMGIAVAGESMNGQNGLELILETQPDIVLTDIYMPVMNGLDMIEQLRLEGYEGKIVVLSGYSDFNYARQALRLQVDDYLSKPVTLDTIKEVFARVAEKLTEERERKLEQEQLQKKLLLYEPLIHKEWMASLVTGADSYGLRESGKQLIDIYDHWKNQSHKLLVIEIVRTTGAADLTILDWNLFRFAIHNVIREILNEQWPDSDCIELHSYHTAVILHMDGNGEPDAAARVKQLARRMIQCVSKFLKLKIHIGIGTCKRNWLEISHSTEEAFRALSYKRIPLAEDFGIYEYEEEMSQSGDVLDFDSSKPSVNQIHFFRKLVESISYGNIKQANQVIHEFSMELNRMEQQLTSNYLQVMSRELWTIMSYSLYESGIRPEEICSEAKLAKQLEAILHPIHFEAWLLRKTQEIFDYSASSMNANHKQAVQFIIQFIHEHYAKEITLADLAEKVYISRSYLSHIFKKATGETFNNYLTRVRMEKARKLILDGKHLIYEVAEMVGYKSLPYFSTLFKKYIGVNPGELK